MPTEAGQSLLNTFDRVRIINLKHRSDRRREIESELTRFGLAVDGEAIAFHEACRPESAGSFPSVGARGCFLSHLGVLEEALAAGTQHLLILEDDLDFSTDAEVRLPLTLARLSQTNWAIFYGGHEQYPGPLDGELLVKADRNGRIRTTHFIALTRPAIEATVPYLRRMLSREPGDPAGGPMHVDGAYSWFRESRPDLETWLAVPVLGDQRPSRTDIAQPGLLDRLPLLSALVSQIRRAKRSWSRSVR